MRRLKVEFDQRARTFPLQGDRELRLGSAGDNDIVVPVAGVSRNHARLAVDDDGLRLVDLGSKNRLIVDGERRGEVFLVPGASVQIGSALVSLEDVATADGDLALRLDASSSVAPLEERETDPVASSSELKTPAAALALVRRYQPAALAGETRRRFLADALAVLGGRTLLRFQTDPERAASGDLVIEDVAGPLPSVEACAELARLEPPGEPRATRLEDGSSCLWLGSPAVMAGRASGAVMAGRASGAVMAGRASGATAVAVLSGHGPEHDGTPQAWIADFLTYVAERLGQEPADDAGSESRGAPPPGELDPPPGMVLGTSPAMRDLLEQVRRSLPSRHDVLLRGETGTGKELFARLLHRSGPSPEGPFIALNCAAIPGDLLEAELFGVEKRVATGVDPRPGLFRQAEGGTLLLDEIADLPPPLQAKLLRVLQEREVLPLGAARPVRVDARVISTTNCDLRERVAAGELRPDLFYRLDRLRFVVPPLRERVEDIPILARTFSQRAAAEGSRRVRGLSVRALGILEAHAWPGNVRELEAVMERAVLRCRNGVLESEHFRELVEPRTGPTPVVTPRRVRESREEPRPRSLKERLELEERRALREALAAAGGNRSQAARRLEISRQGLIDKLRRLGLDDE